MKRTFDDKILTSLLYLFSFFFALILTAFLSGNPVGLILNPLLVIAFPLGMFYQLELDQWGGLLLGCFSWFCYLAIIVAGIKTKEKMIFAIFVVFLVLNVGGCTTLLGDSDGWW